MLIVSMVTEMPQPSGPSFCSAPFVAVARYMSEALLNSRGVVVTVESTDPTVVLCKAEAEGGFGTLPRVLIVSDVRLHREGMAALLTNQIEIVGIVEKAELASCAPHLVSDVVLIDVRCLTSGARGTAPGTVPPGKMVAFGVSHAESEILACAKAGVCGFIDKDGSVEDVVATIAGVARGEQPCTPRFVGTLFQWLTSIVHSRALEPVAPALSSRELEVSRYLVQGRSNKEIARQLRISTATVKNHVHHILEELQVHRRAEAVLALTHFRQLLAIYPCCDLAVEMLVRS
jgi:two-component system, NarL family, nitrate/nitrite response regulator NarL